MRNEYKIDVIEDPILKSAYTREVLERLPEWFGNREAMEGYVREVRKLPYWAAFGPDGECIGFFAAKTHYSSTGEIVVCGVLPEYHRLGVGRSLYARTEEYFRQCGCRYVIVKTLSDMVAFEPYKRTRNFYRSIGFEPLVSLTEMWDEQNPCLIMLKRLS